MSTISDTPDRSLPRSRSVHVIESTPITQPDAACSTQQAACSTQPVSHQHVAASLNGGAAMGSAIHLVPSVYLGTFGMVTGYLRSLLTSARHTRIYPTYSRRLQRAVPQRGPRSLHVRRRGRVPRGSIYPDYSRRLQGGWGSQQETSGPVEILSHGSPGPEWKRRAAGCAACLDCLWFPPVYSVRDPEDAYTNPHR